MEWWLPGTRPLRTVGSTGRKPEGWGLSNASGREEYGKVEDPVFSGIDFKGNMSLNKLLSQEQ